MKRDIDLRGASRRNFVKGVVSTCAALGLGPTRALEILDKMGGSALAAEYTPRYTVHLVFGTGSFSWLTLLFPPPKVISQFAAGFAYDAPTKTEMLTFGNRQLAVRKLPSGKRLWQDYGDKKAVSAFVVGRPLAHDISDVNTNPLPGGVGGEVQLMAGTSSIQVALKTLVSVIGINFNNRAMPYGRALGVPGQSNVTSADGMIGLFSSSASQVVSRLQQDLNQKAFQYYYTAFIGETKGSQNPTRQRAFTDSRLAVNLLAKNLRTELQPKAGQKEMWSNNVDKVFPFAEALIVTANAFRLGLCAQVSIPGPNDDPHSAFADGTGTSAGRIADGYATALQMFMDTLAQIDSPFHPGKKISDALVMTMCGDTPKNAFVASNWPDGTPGGSNQVYVMSQGLCKPGWFGDLAPGSKRLFNPASGQLLNANGDLGPTTEDIVRNGVMASILYATTGGDDRRARDFYTGDFGGLVNPALS